MFRVLSWIALSDISISKNTQTEQAGSLFYFST
jgi:hypothetical protein